MYFAFGGIGQHFSKVSHRKLQKDCTRSKPTKTKFLKNDELSFFFIWFCMIYQIRDIKNPSSKAALEKQRSHNVTLNLNRKHVLSHVGTSQEVLKTASSVTTIETRRAQLQATILDSVNVILESLRFGVIGQMFSHELFR